MESMPLRSLGLDPARLPYKRSRCTTGSLSRRPSSRAMVVFPAPPGPRMATRRTTRQRLYGRKRSNNTPQAIPSPGRRRAPRARLDSPCAGAHAPRPRRSSSARSDSARPTGSSTCTRSTAAASARWRRASARRVAIRRAARAAQPRASSLLHQGRGELQTVTGVELVHSHHAARERPLPARGRDGRRRGDAAALPRAGSEPARVPGAHPLPRPRWTTRAETRAQRPGLDPLALSFQLKLLWLSGYLPHLTSCAECGAETRPRRLLASGGRGASARRARRRDAALADGAARDRGAAPPAARRGARSRPHRARRAEALGVITASHEYHGGFRLRTLASDRLATSGRGQGRSWTQPCPRKDHGRWRHPFPGLSALAAPNYQDMIRALESYWADAAACYGSRTTPSSGRER